jgi:predicted nucleic acid-binding protein
MIDKHRVFIDTSFIISKIIINDYYHFKAEELNKNLKSVKELWLHEGILLEIADWFADKNRVAAMAWIDAAKENVEKYKIIPLTRDLVDKCFDDYKKYSDKTIGATDFISFNVMWKNEITQAATTDHHFQQVGFKALLLE